MSGKHFDGCPRNSFLDVAVTERRSNPSTAYAPYSPRVPAGIHEVCRYYYRCEAVVPRQGSVKTLSLAIHLYIDAARVFEPDPPVVPRLAKATVRTHLTTDDIRAETDLE
ncbi:uncharacterized protein FTOL_00237 [Fusarium torulosum]|uniref:Uncharacterized protein n=1 Tax=Fusarium torulosum TaxID=33205 RepID=A0AAE8LY03_9HYPO|nr:uncharacterized protein FTOL_00237 [Fusarium torulosum]